MAEYITSMDETNIVKKMLLSKGSDFYLNMLVPDENILKREPSGIYQFPCIVISKISASEEGFVGDIGTGDSLENIQPSTIVLSIRSLHHIEKTYNGVNYKEEELVRLIRDVIKQIMFQNKQFSDDSQPDTEYIVEYMASDIDTGAITMIGPVFMINLTYTFTFRMIR